MAAPKEFPNLTHAGRGRPKLEDMERTNVSLRSSTKQALIEIGGGKNSIGKAIEKVYQFWVQHHDRTE